MNQSLLTVPMTSGNGKARDLYAQGLRQFQSYVGDPVATLESALSGLPDFMAAHLFRGLALYTMMERKLVPEAMTSLQKARALATHANDRERGQLEALQLLIAGDWHGACRVLDKVLLAYPLDALTLQVAHLMDFYRGDAMNLRNRVSRALPYWTADVPGYSYVLGMHAFGLEEMNQHAAAEATARRALAIEPRDGWAVHAAVHVMEMQGRVQDGIAWLTSRERDWAPDNAFAFHNYWHLALLEMDRGDYTRCLALFDRRVHPSPAPFVLSLIDATALLWRLRLESVDVEARFERIADEWEERLALEPFYAFNDFHAALAFVATGRARSLDLLSRSMQHAASGKDANAAMTREIGLPLVRGFDAFGRGRYAQAVEIIEPIRDIAQGFGGSHAQRDIITLTLIEASLRARDARRARHYIAERVVHKPASAWGRRLWARGWVPQESEAIAAC